LSSLLTPTTRSFTEPTNGFSEISPQGWGYFFERDVQSVLNNLTDAFAEPFALIDVDSGDVVHSDYGGLSCDHFRRIELLAEVARRGKPEIVESISPVALFAIPLVSLNSHWNLVAVGVFAIQSIACQEEVAAAAHELGTDVAHTFQWISGREIWSERTLLRMAELILDNLVHQKKIDHLKVEINEAVSQARDNYVELGLLHRLANQLLLSHDNSELWQKTLCWLAEKMPAQCVAIVPNHKLDYAAGLSAELKCHGACPIIRSELEDLVEKLRPAVTKAPLVLNRLETSLPTWHLPEISELICVPIPGRSEPFGWLFALNINDPEESDLREFTSVETQLLSSVATILGIHSNNLQLNHEQSELLASAVKALTSAIDAKDGYTAGHSDRVAQISVMLAKKLGLGIEEQETIYLAGLLHDIGKIGIDDQVLKKPGKLTDEEYDQIKLHPQCGYDILKGVKQLEDVLPLVLHHHEAWNGRGYPHGLEADATPLMARIVAVADSYDAMSSDRSYRAGMSDEKLDSILREGAGSQWDPQVVEAFFAIRDEIRHVSENSSGELSEVDASAV
jgi:hypothetical protein